MSQTITTQTINQVGFQYVIRSRSGTGTEQVKSISKNRFRLNGQIINIEIDYDGEELSNTNDKKTVVIAGLDYSGSMENDKPIIDAIAQQIYKDDPLCEDIWFIPYATESTCFPASSYPKINGQLRTLDNYNNIGGSTYFIPFINSVNDILSRYNQQQIIPKVFMFTDGQGYDNYASKAQQLVLYIKSLGGSFTPILFGDRAIMTAFGPTIKFTNIEDLSEIFLGIHSDLNKTNEVELQHGLNKITLTLTQINKLLSGSVLFPFNLDPSKKTFVRINDRVIPLEFDPRPIDTDLESRLSVITGALQNITSNALVYGSIEMSYSIINIIKELKEINKTMSDDARVKIINRYVDDILSKILVSSAGRNVSANISALRNLGETINKMTRLCSSIVSGRIRRNVKNAGRKLAIYSADIEEKINRFLMLQFPKERLSLLTEDSSISEIQGPTVMFASINGPVNYLEFDQVLDGISWGDLTLAAVINNSASALISGSTHFICSDTLATISNLEKLTLTKRSLLIPYANHDPEWLLKAYRLYAGLILVGHPIELSTNSGQVFLSGMASLLHNTSATTLYNMKDIFYLYGYADAFLQSKLKERQRFEIIQDYLSNPLAIPMSRSEDHDGQLPNIQTALGALMICTGPEIGPRSGSRSNYNECIPLIKSIVMENIRQFIQSRVQDDPKIYDRLITVLQEKLGLTTYVDSETEIDCDSLLSKYNLRLKAIANDEETTNLLRDDLLDLVSVKFDGFVQQTCSLEDLSEFLPSRTNGNTMSLVPSYYSMTDLNNLLSKIKNLSLSNWLEKANETLGYVPDDVCLEFLGTLEEIISDEMIIEILVQLASTKGRPLLDSYEPYDTCWKHLPECTSIKNINSERLKKIIDKLIHYVFEPSSNVNPISILGLLKLDSNLDIDNLYILINKFNNFKTEFNGHAKILDLIGLNIISEKVQDQCLRAGISKLLIDMSVQKHFKPNGACPPSSKNMTKSFQKVLRAIKIDAKQYDDSEITKKAVDMIKQDRCDTAKELLKMDFDIITIKSQDIMKASKEYPEITELGGFHVMIYLDKMVFIKYRNGRQEYYHCIGINNEWKAEPFSDDIKLHWSDNIMELPFWGKY